MHSGSRRRFAGGFRSCGGSLRRWRECDQNAATQAIVEDKRKVEKQQLLRKEIKSRFVNASMIRFL